MTLIIRSRILEFLCRPEARGTAVSLDSTNEDRYNLKSLMAYNEDYHREELVDDDVDEDPPLREDQRLDDDDEGSGRSLHPVLRLSNASFSWHQTR